MAAIEQFGFSLSNLKIIVINWKVCQVYIIMGIDPPPKQDRKLPTHAYCYNINRHVQSALP